MLEEKLIRIMRTYPPFERDLERVRLLRLPDGCIAAGYVRNYVWDFLHGYERRTPLNDADVIYYDPDDLREETEKKYEQELRHQLPEYNWSCKNQARMHLVKGHRPYSSVEDAMRRWPETATAVGVRLDWNGNIQVVAPHGLEDLFSLVIRRSPLFKDEQYFRARIQRKRWLELWPGLRVVDEDLTDNRRDR